MPRTGTPWLQSGVARIRIRGIVVPETGLGRIRRMALIAIARIAVTVSISIRVAVPIGVGIAIVAPIAG